jgi:hypothetical protein
MQEGDVEIATIRTPGSNRDASYCSGIFRDLDVDLRRSYSLLRLILNIMMRRAINFLPHLVRS